MKFRGGYTFKNFEGASEPVLREITAPGRIVIPLSFGDGLILTPSVSAGETVRAGDPLLASSGGNVSAPVSGTVSEINPDTIVIESDGFSGNSAFSPVDGHSREPWHLERAEIFDLFRSTGCSFLAGGRFDTLERCGSVKDIIVNAVHNAPLNRTWTPEVFGEPDVFPNGLKVLRALFGDAVITIAANKRNRGYFESPEIRESANTAVVSDRYPQEHPEILSRTIVDKPLISPLGKPDESVAVVDFTDVIQISETMTQGRPLIDRIVMIAGAGVSNPGWYRVRIGTQFEDILSGLLKSDADTSWRIIRGDIFTGRGLEAPEGSVMFGDSEISVIKEHASRDLFSFMMPGFAADSYSRTTVAEYLPLFPKKLETNVHGGVRPCVQCNYCDEVCPADIYPFLIWKHVEADLVEESFRLRPYDCVECGLCDYVCPSKIDIMSSVKISKEKYCEIKGADDVSD
ncbi:4Fe-4S dicluster domain-containing protein [Candidatus Latescibacterota bacterium]